MRNKTCSFDDASLLTDELAMIETTESTSILGVEEDDQTPVLEQLAIALFFSTTLLSWRMNLLGSQTTHSKLCLRTAWF
jgi:hypothetical protein